MEMTVTPYEARCALCPWRSAIAENDDAAFSALSRHGTDEHPAYGFPGGQLVPVCGLVRFIFLGETIRCTREVGHPGMCGEGK